MKKLNLTANVSHPIHQALSELYVLVSQARAEFPSTVVEGLLRATMRARGAVKIAGSGVRRGHHLGMAVESLTWTQNALEVLLFDGKITPELFDELRRRLDQILQGIELLSGAGDGNWSTVELPALADPPADLVEEPTIKPVRLLVARVAELLLALRKREPVPAPGPTTPKKKAA